MAKLPICTLTFTDADNRTMDFRAQWRLTTPPAAADVQALAADVQALTRMGLLSASVTFPVDISGQATATDATASRQVDWALQVRKSELRNSRGGTYTFRKLPHFVAALDQGVGDGILNGASALIEAFLENFDDGSGIAAVVGDWYISDGEEVIEDTAGGQVIRAYKNKD